MNEPHTPLTAEVVAQEFARIEAENSAMHRKGVFRLKEYFLEGVSLAASLSRNHQLQTEAQAALYRHMMSALRPTSER